MKLRLALLAFAVMMANLVYAQSRIDSMRFKKDTLTKVCYGIKAGANMNSIMGDSTYKKGMTPGFAIGGFVSSDRKKLGVRAEVMISSSKYDIKDDSFHHNSYFSLLNADIVALAEYEIAKGLWLQAGPQFSTFISVNENPSLGIDPRNYFKANNFGGVLGLEYRASKHIHAGARYVQGLSNIRSNIATNTGQSWMTSTIHLYVGYRIK